MRGGSMNKLELYEKKILSDKEFPIQLFMNQIRKKGQYFPSHWHEHIELHYIFEGTGDFQCNQQNIRAGKDSLLVINSNEVHIGISERNKLDAIVAIFEMDAFSEELANQNIIFQSLIQDDKEIKRLAWALYAENEEKKLGYKLAAKGILYELITYLARNYAVESLSESESIKRNRNLTRLNLVLQYIEEHFTETISNHELAKLIHLSEDRFNHLFKESMGMSPLNYINEIRLKKAMYLLKQKEYTVSEVAIEVGFKDFNHFGRLFRRYYGCTPSSMKKK